MDERIKGMWVDALLSGEYPKTNAYLHNDEGYCAYGVLCDLAVQECVLEEPVYYANRSGHPPHYSYDGMANQPPESVADWAGLEEGQVKDHNGTELWMINDGSDDFDRVIRTLKDL